MTTPRADQRPSNQGKGKQKQDTKTITVGKVTRSQSIDDLKHTRDLQGRILFLRTESTYYWYNDMVIDSKHVGYGVYLWLHPETTMLHT